MTVQKLNVPQAAAASADADALVLAGLDAHHAGRLQQAGSGLVDVVFPGREQLDVRPLPHGVAGRRAGFKDEGLKSPFEQMCRSSEADPRRPQCRRCSRPRRPAGSRHG